MTRSFHFPFGALCLALFVTAGTRSLANDIQVTNVSFSELDLDQGIAMLSIDLHWENSWRGNTADQRDAAWLFIKYRDSSGAWNHARLANAGHVAPAGCSLDIGLVNTSTAHHPSTNPVVGVFVYRSSEGSGTFTVENLEIAWPFGVQSITIPEMTDIRVFAYEMVFVPEGAFAAGSGGSETNAFTLTTINTANAATAPSGVGALGGQGGGFPTGQTAPNTNWPNGFRAFYCMKYEVSQQQYVDFLNTLTRTQQSQLLYNNFPPGATSTANTSVMFNGSGSGARISIRCDAEFDAFEPLTLYCDLNGNGIGGEANDGLWLACNYLMWTQMGIFLGWSGLRPMTELEFEKACRGDRLPLANEYPWGTTTAAAVGTPLTNAGSSNEGVVNYSTTNGNAHFGATVAVGPRRVGIMSANPSNTGKISAGSTEYGVMEMAGNLAELVVEMQSAPGRAFTGLHGSGGFATSIPGWPSYLNYIGTGLRGGSYLDGANQMRISDRTTAFDPVSIGYWYHGFRGVRTSP